MLINRDCSERFLLAVYWQDNLLIFVVKEILANGTLREQTAVGYSAADAQLLMNEFWRGRTEIHGIFINRLTAIAIAGHIAAGLKCFGAQDISASLPIEPRIRPALWN